MANGSDYLASRPPGGLPRRTEGRIISYCASDSPLGTLVVGATDRGVCFVGLGEEALSGLRHDRPGAALVEDVGGLRDLAGPILEYLEGGGRTPELPLDLSGTEFQHRVWAALRAIPYGRTRTYRELASELGSAAHVRAVGRACAINPASLVVPCHRVVRLDGGLAGYRWGLHRKRALLDLERGPSPQAL